jgi:acetyl esterase
MLNARLRAYLDENALLGAKATSDLTPPEVRVGAVTRLEKYVGELVSMAKVDEIYISGPTSELPVRFYRPQLTQNMPAIVIFHGGGWVARNIKLFEAQHRLLAQESGCVVIAVNYQKSPEHKFPIPHDDCYFALKWAIQNATKLGLDAERIGVAGDSAGANLAIGVSLRARDTSGPKIAFQILIYPTVDHKFDYPSMIENADGYMLTTDAMKWYLKQYRRDEVDQNNPYAIPMRAQNLKNLPPTLIITAQYDPLRDEGEAFAKRLGDDGVKVFFKRYEGMIHGFCVLLGFLPEGKLAYEEIGSRVKEIIAN